MGKRIIFRCPENQYRFVKKVQKALNHDEMSDTLRALLTVMEFQLEAGLLMAPVTEEGRKIVEAFMKEKGYG